MPYSCIVVGCKSRGNVPERNFFRFPMLDARSSKSFAKSEARQQSWINVLNRPDFSPCHFKYAKVCDLHFVSGRSASLHDVANIDWTPTLNMGHGTEMRDENETSTVNLKQAIRDLVNCYKTGLSFIRGIEENSKNGTDIEFIGKHLDTIRTNENSISFYVSILENELTKAREAHATIIESEIDDDTENELSNETETHTEATHTSIKCEIDDHTEDQLSKATEACTEEIMISIKSEIVDDTENELLKATNASTEGTVTSIKSEIDCDTELIDPLYEIASSVNRHVDPIVVPANDQYVSHDLESVEVKYIVTCGNDQFLPEEIEKPKRKRPEPTAKPQPTKPRKDYSKKFTTNNRMQERPFRLRYNGHKIRPIYNIRKPKKFVSQPVADYIEQIRAGTINFREHWRHNMKLDGLCVFCDEVITNSRYAWPFHFLRHTMEQYFYCTECGSSFSRRIEHTSCAESAITNIFRHNDCISDEYLAAFMCGICNYVQVSERSMIDHLRNEHFLEGNEQTYEKCKFINW